jgi:homoserine O-acetyltransferase/O-succinyltransferase
MQRKLLYRISLILLTVGIAFQTQVAAQELNNVEKKYFQSRDFKLKNGQALPVLTIAYETYGKLAPDGRNAVLITHGYTSNHHVAGRYAPSDPAPGTWDGLIGPGKAIDTNRYFVVASNNLGSSYGSTSPASINPVTGKQYGPDFPSFSILDTIAAQKLLLKHLGAKHLAAVAGFSYGGRLAFLWGVTYPEFVDGIVPVVIVPNLPNNPKRIDNLIARLSKDPNWNGGWYYDKGGIPTAMTDIRIRTLKSYGIEAALKDEFPDSAAREAEIRRQAELWAKTFDGHSLVVLRRAALGADIEKDFHKMRGKVKVLYVLSSTDRIYPPSIAPAVMKKLKAAGVDGQFFELKSNLGHSASGLDAAKWAPALRAFMERISGK